MLVAGEGEQAGPLLKKHFPPSEFLLQFVPSGERALECALAWQPDVVLLNWELPGISGLETCRLLKQDPRTQGIALVALSSQTDEEKIVSALCAGADEHLGKPYHLRELYWRVVAVLRRYARAGRLASPREEDSLLKRGAVQMRLDQRAAFVGRKKLALTKTEFDLLEVFLRSPGKVLSRPHLLETVWGYDPEVSTRTVDLFVSRLRRKLGPAAAPCLQSVPGVGYTFREKS